MATPINAPLTSEIWHLSIDDLLAPICESPRLGGPGPFVINLSASSAPLSRPDKTFVTPGDACVYQIQRMEDRRPRFRLRLGPFATEDAADAMLAIVRDVYPSALTATAESDDLKAIAALHPKTQTASAVAAAQPAPAASMAPTVAQPPVEALPPPTAARPAEHAVERPHFPPATASIPVLSDSVERVPRTPPPPALARPVATRTPTPPLAATGVSVAPTVARAPAPPPAVARAAAIPPAVARAPAPPPAVARAPAPPSAVARAAAIPPAVATIAARPPSLESTQTLRPLTTSELQDSGARWYVVQLSLSSESFDPDKLPNLDIFKEYRLYSVSGLDEGRIVHALRLGFFADEVAAGVVASYLATFYEKPTVKRISFAERERFRDQRVEARKDIGATGRHAVIEITGERHVREKRSHIAAVTALAPAASSSQSTATPSRRGR